VDGGVVYAGDSSNLYALDEVTGKLLWQGAVAQADYGDSPTVANGMVYVGSTDAHIYGFAVGGCGTVVCPPVFVSATFGYRGGPPALSSPAVANGVLYAAVMDGLGGIAAFDAVTGNCLYFTQPFPDDTGIGPTHSPAVLNGVVYAGTGYSGGLSGHLIAFNASTGTMLWNYKTRPNLGPVLSSPSVVIENNNQTFIYIGSSKGLYKFDSAGTIVWGPRLGGPVGNSSVAVANNGTYGSVIFEASTDGNLYAFDTTGTQLGSPHAIGSGSAVESSPVVANQVVYVGASDGKVYAFK
jgi:outer membrane protein assembly factor BamB